MGGGAIFYDAVVWVEPVAAEPEPAFSASLPLVAEVVRV
jgi:hypothetical protein